MTEILTESFCERCGTRYTFETARPKNSRIGRARTLTKGLRNFVLSDDPLSVAMADARGEEERAATALQLDAFHKTFNFCLSCRQYTCSNCWNADDGRCLSCAPRPDTVPVEPVDSAAIAQRLAAMAAPPALEPHEVIGISAWPEADLQQRAPEEAAAVLAEPEAAIAPAPEEAVAATIAEAEPEGAPAEALASTVGEAEPEAASAEAVAAEPEPLAGVGGAVAVEPEAVEGVRVLEPVAPETEQIAPEPLESVAAAPEPIGAEAVAVAPGAIEEAVAEVEPVVATGAVTAETEPVAVEAVAAEAATEPVAVEAVAAEAETEPVVADTEPTAAPQLQGLRPGESLDHAIAAYEAALAAEETEAAEALQEGAAEPQAIGPVVEAEPGLAAEPVPVAGLAEPVAEPEPVAAVAEPVAAVAEPVAEPEPVAAVAEPVAGVAEPVAEPVAAVAEPVGEPEPVAASTPVVPPMPAPVPLAPGWLTVAPDDGLEPVWPQRPTWPATTRGPLEGATLAGRRMMPTNDAAALWAASAREVLETGPLADQGSLVSQSAAPSAQPCVGCGLPLSANARFCRRCGSRQG